MLRTKMKESMGDAYYAGMEDLLKRTAKNLKLPAISRDDEAKFYLHQMFEALFAKREELKAILRMIEKDLGAIQKMQQKMLQLEESSEDVQDSKNRLKETLGYDPKYQGEAR